jgi:hypothetical protein
VTNKFSLRLYTRHTHTACISELGSFYRFKVSQFFSHSLDVFCLCHLFFSENYCRTVGRVESRKNKLTEKNGIGLNKIKNIFTFSPIFLLDIYFMTDFFVYFSRHACLVEIKSNEDFPIFEFLYFCENYEIQYEKQ